MEANGPKGVGRRGQYEIPMVEPSMNEVFMCSEITKITDAFKTCIGEGAYGQVFLGIMSDGTRVAVKVLSTQDCKDFSEEAKLLRIRHKNLVTLVGYCDDDFKKALIYTYIPNGDLGRHLSENSERILPWKERLKIGEDIAEGINFLHNREPPIVHRDLKPANILLTEDMQAKIADFGLSRVFATEFATHLSTRRAGTFGFLDPHVAVPGHARKELDVYSFGVILLVLLTGKPAIIKEVQNAIHVTQWVESVTKSFAKNKKSFAIDGESIQSIIDPRLQGEFNIYVAKKAIELAMSCVKPIIRERPNMSHALEKLKAISNLKERPGSFTKIRTLGLLCYPSTNSQSQNISSQMEFNDKPSFKVYCKTDPAFSLSIRDGEVILAPTNASDPFQHWFKDENCGSIVKDKEGVPSFALVNKATGQAIKHSIGPNHPVQLVFHNSNKINKSVLWTEDKNVESGYILIRMVINTSLCIDICDDHVAEGNHIMLCPRNYSSNQWWKIEQHSSELPSSSLANSQNNSSEIGFSNKPSFKIYCKIDPNFSFTIRRGKVVLAPTNPSDLKQHWYKEEKYGSSMKDEEDVSSFALVNKDTGQAIKHSIGINHPMQLAPHDPKKVDKSVLWTESLELDNGYKSIRMVTDTNLCMDAPYGFVGDGAKIILHPRNYSSNQWWKIEQHSSELPSSSLANSQNNSSETGFSNKPSVKIYCKIDPNFSFTIRRGKVVLAPTSPSDLKQHWYKEEKYGSLMKDEEDVPSFALVNKDTGQAIKHSIGINHPMQLVPHDPKKVDKSVLWTESLESDNGYKSIRMVTDTNLCMDAPYGYVGDGANIILHPRNYSSNQWWKIEQHSSELPSSSLANSQNNSSETGFSNKPSFKIYCKIDPNFSFTIRRGKVVLAPTNPSDLKQHWYKEEKYGSLMKDEEGVPSFALVNKDTGQAIKHSIRSNHPMQLVPHDPKKVDKSVLWTESLESDNGYKSIKMVTDNNLCMDARYGFVGDGVDIILHPRKYVDNQWWKIEQHSCDLPSSSSTNSQNVLHQMDFNDKPTFNVYCKTNSEFSLSISSDGKLVLVVTNLSDSFQHWYKDERCVKTVEDKDGIPFFALVNKATAQAIKYSTEANHLVQLVSYNPNEVDKSVLWAEKDLEKGYKSIQAAANTSLYMDAHRDYVILWPRNCSDNQLWKIQQHSPPSIQL